MHNTVLYATVLVLAGAAVALTRSQDARDIARDVSRIALRWALWNRTRAALAVGFLILALITLGAVTRH